MFCLPLSCWDNSTRLHFLTLNIAFLSTTTKVCWGFIFFANHVTVLTAQMLGISWWPLHGQDRHEWIWGSAETPECLLPSCCFKCHIWLHGGHCEKEEKESKIAYDLHYLQKITIIYFVLSWRKAAWVNLLMSLFLLSESFGMGMLIYLSKQTLSQG